MYGTLDLTLFGSPEVRLNGQPVTSFRTSKAQALLYYLAVTDRPHTRATLAGLLWGDQPEDAARASLSKCLSNLRDLLGEAVVIKRQTVAFNRDHPYDLDTERFAAAVGQPPAVETSQALQAALALYRGDLLEGFYVREVPDFEQWLLVQRAHYREAVITGLHTLAGFHEQQGDLPSAITHTRRLLTLEPWREEAHRQLMLLLARSGQRAAALAQFETCRQILDEELAVEPDAETSQLYNNIRDDRLAPTLRQATAITQTMVTNPLPSPHHDNLPHPLSPLIGRTLELTELDRLMFDHHERLITITGPGGMGKTRLALAEQQLAANRFRDGAWFVSLVATEDAQTIIPTLASVLKLTDRGNRTSQETRKQQVLDFLRDKQLLLIFDNFEQVVEGRTLLVEILTAAPAVYLLVTSRERLHLRAEQVYPISGLECPATISDVTAPALTLFLRTAQRTHLRFQPNAREQQDLVRICQLTAGMPLALELTAGWVNLLPTTAIAEALQANLDLLATTMHDVPVRHRSMRATFDTSWHLLGEGERHIFAQLSVFRGGFKRDAAQQVVGATIQQLSVLADKSLIEYQRPADRYDIHELLRQWGAAKLKEAGNTADVRTCHLQYFLLLAEILEVKAAGTPAPTTLDIFVHEYENFRAALRWGFTSNEGERCNGWKAAWLAARLGHFWYTSDYWSEGRMWLAKALSVLDTEPSVADYGDDIALRAKLLYSAGVLAYAQSDLVNAQHMLEASLAINQNRGDQHAMVRCLNELTSIANLRGAYDQATVFIETSLALGHSLGDQRLIGRSLLNLSDLATEQGNFQAGMAYASESLAIFRKLDVMGSNVVGLIGSAFVMLAQAAIGLGEYKRALGYLEEAMLVHRNAQKKVGPWTMRVLGLVHQMLGNYEPAIDAYRDSLIMRHAREEISGMAWALEGLGEATALLGQFRRATVLWGAAATLRQRCDSAIGHGDLPRHESIVLIVQNQLTAAAFTSAWTKGAAMSPTQVVAYALADSDQ